MQRVMTRPEAVNLLQSAAIPGGWEKPWLMTGVPRAHPWVVCVDVRKLNVEEISDHLLRRSTALDDEFLSHLPGPALEGHRSKLERRQTGVFC